MKSWKEFKEEFDTVPIYTRKQYAEAIEQTIKQHTVNRVIQKGKDYDIALMILAIKITPDGMIVIVK